MPPKWQPASATEFDMANVTEQKWEERSILKAVDADTKKIEEGFRRPGSSAQLLRTAVVSAVVFHLELPVWDATKQFTPVNILSGLVVPSSHPSFLIIRSWS